MKNNCAMISLMTASVLNKKERKEPIYEHAPNSRIEAQTDDS